MPKCDRCGGEFGVLDGVFLEDRIVYLCPGCLYLFYRDMEQIVEMFDETAREVEKNKIAWTKKEQEFFTKGLKKLKTAKIETVLTSEQQQKTKFLAELGNELYQKFCKVFRRLLNERKTS